MSRNDDCSTIEWVDCRGLLCLHLDDGGLSNTYFGKVVGILRRLTDTFLANRTCRQNVAAAASPKGGYPRNVHESRNAEDSPAAAQLARIAGKRKTSSRQKVTGNNALAYERPACPCGGAPPAHLPGHRRPEFRTTTAICASTPEGGGVRGSSSGCRDSTAERPSGYVSGDRERPLSAVGESVPQSCDKLLQHQLEAIADPPLTCRRRPRRRSLRGRRKTRDSERPSMSQGRLRGSSRCPSRAVTEVYCAGAIRVWNRASRSASR